MDASLNGKYIIAGGDHDKIYFFNQTTHALIGNPVPVYDDILDIKFSYNSKRFILGT